MKIRFQKPSASLEPYIECYWSWESHGENSELYPLPKVIPNTDTEILFYYSTPFSIVSSQGNIHHLPQSHIVSLKSKAFELSHPNYREIGFFAVRFRRGCFRHFYKGMLEELPEIFLPLSEVWGYSGKEIEERIIAPLHFEQRVHMIEAFLHDRLADCMKQDDWIDAVIATLVRSNESMKLESIIQSLHIGERQFQRLFKQSIGMPAKQFQRLIRFETTIKQLMQLGKNRNSLSTILGHGYYDQSHFNREFQLLVHTTPSELLQDKRYMSLFYNTPSEG